jgi:DNA-binding ferritin-like protein
LWDSDMILRKVDEVAENYTRVGESPVVETEIRLAVSRVARVTRNPV